MKIMTFNTLHCMNYITRKIDFEVMAETIRKCGADIVGLNEMRNKGTAEDYDDQTTALSALTGLPFYYFAQAIDGGGSTPYGNAILSKYPIQSVEIVPVPDPVEKKYEKRYYESRCLLKAKFECGLTVLVIHFGLNPDEQQNAVKTVMENLESEKCILMGDFNVTPENEVLKPIREVMRDTADFFDTPKLSFPSDNPEVKIDYIFVSPDIEVVSADIPAIIASDHRPCVSEVNI